MTATNPPPTSNHNATTNGFETSEPVAGKVPIDTFRPKEDCTVGLATTNVWLPSAMLDGNDTWPLMVPLAATVKVPRRVGVDMTTNSTPSPGVRPEAKIPI